MGYRNLIDRIKDWIKNLIKNLIKPKLLLVLVSTALVVVLFLFFSSGRNIEDKEIIFPELPDILGAADGYRILTTPSDRRLIVAHATKKIDEDGRWHYVNSLCLDAFPDVNAPAEEKSIEVTPKGGNVGIKTDSTDAVGSYESVKLFRDALTGLCQGVLNDWISTEKDQWCFNDLSGIDRLGEMLIRHRIRDIDNLFDKWKKNPGSAKARKDYLLALNNYEALVKRRCSVYEILFTRFFDALMEVQKIRASRDK